MNNLGNIIVNGKWIDLNYCSIEELKKTLENLNEAEEKVKFALDKAIVALL